MKVTSEGVNRNQPNRESGRVESKDFIRILNATQAEHTTGLGDFTIRALTSMTLHTVSLTSSFMLWESSESTLWIARNKDCDNPIAID